MKIRLVTHVQRPAVLAILMSLSAAESTKAESFENDFCEVTIDELQTAYNSGTAKVEQVIGWHLGQIESLDRAGPQYGALTFVDTDGARQAARELDRMTAGQKEGLPLFGVPIVVKDMIDVAGMPTGGSSLILGSAPAKRDSASVARLRQAGAVILAKANMTGISQPYLAGYSPFAITVNPYDADYSPQGSSNGSAVAVSTNLAVAALGEETTDSLRSVADAAGIATLRPTRGSVSTDGMFPLSRGLDVIGPMARNVKDVARVYEVLRECGLACGKVRQLPDLHGVRLGVPALYAGSAAGGPDFDSEILELFKAALGVLRLAGAEIIDVDSPSFTPTDGLLAPSDDHYRSLGFPDWTSQAFDAEENFEERRALDLYFRHHGSGKFSNIKDVVKSSRKSADVRDWLWASEYGNEAAARRVGKPTQLDRFDRAIEELYRRDAVRIVEENRLDAFVFPTTHRSPLSLIDTMRDEKNSGENVFVYAPVDFGLPALVVPMGFVAAGLPSSLTFMGLRGQDERLLELGIVYERLAAHRVRPARSCVKRVSGS